MRKTLSFLALAVILFVSISAHTSRVIAAKEGYTVPALTIAKGDGEVSVSDFKGKYLLLTFWASTDAQSRIRCKEYESITGKCAKVESLSINLDRNSRLFNEIVDNDNLNPASQLNLPESQIEAVIADFALNEGLNSFLIDPLGRVVAINPTAEMIASV